MQIMNVGRVEIIGRIKEVKGEKTCFIMKAKHFDTVNPGLEAHMEVIHFEVFLKNIHLISQNQMVQ